MSKTVLVTGGSRGIGAATVRKMVRDGWQTAFCYRGNEQAAAALTDALPGVLAVRADVSDGEQVNALFEVVLQRFGRLDALVCNAGVALPQRLLADTTERQLDAVTAVNVKGALLCCREAAALMAAAHGGSIVTVASVWGQVGGSCEAAYSASKGAVIALTKALAKELGPAGVRVNCVSPGVIDTDMNAHLSPDDKAALADQTPLCRLGAPEEVAAAIAFLCGDDASFITGQVLGVDGGWGV